MFEKFGELNSFGEINELAENLFNEGDTESLRAMAKENGIQSDFVDMYLQGEIPALCDQLTAALGKIDVEVAELKPKEIAVYGEEPGREENATEAHEPEDDGGAVGETGADDVQEIEKGGMEDHGAADEAGTGQEEDDTDGEESGQADCEEPAERTDEQTGAQSQGEEIAPAQKSTETLEKEEVEDDETGEK